jgi:hypothetical protein
LSPIDHGCVSLSYEAIAASVRDPTFGAHVEKR